MKTKISNIVKTFTLVLIIPMALTTISFSSDDPVNTVLGCDQLVNLSTSYSEALTAFQSNPSEESCNSLRNSALDFIQGFDNCTQFADQYGDLEEAAQELTELDCSQY